MHDSEASKSGESPKGTGVPKFCKQCHYPLHGLVPAGACPECGQNYNLRD